MNAGEPKHAVGEELETAPVDDEATQILEKLVSEVMRIQRRFGHEARNLQADRKDQIREAIEKVAGEAA